MSKDQDKVLYIVFVLIIVFMLACKNKYIVSSGDDPNFKIIENLDNDFSDFNRKVDVFGIPIYAVRKVDDNKLLHAANVMAQYLDNDEDGCVDNEAVLNEMISSGAFMVMWNRESDLNRIVIPEGREGQDLGSDETQPDWHQNGHSGRFDAALEEVLHIITHAGFSKVYPDVFGEFQGTDIANAMDIARGGTFMSIPDSYPSSAWYSYDDKTCEYNCQVTEYLYWSLTSILGAQENRSDEISQEWTLNTRQLVAQTDTLVFSLLTNTEYSFPSILPDGTYRR